MVLLDCERFDEIRQILEQCNDETLQKELDQVKTEIQSISVTKFIVGREFWKI